MFTECLTKVAENALRYFEYITEPCDAKNFWYAMLPYLANKVVATIVYTRLLAWFLEQNTILIFIVHN
jgi:hypothetical protein